MWYYVDLICELTANTNWWGHRKTELTCPHQPAISVFGVYCKFCHCHTYQQHLHNSAMGWFTLDKPFSINVMHGNAWSVLKTQNWQNATVHLYSHGSLWLQCLWFFMLFIIYCGIHVTQYMQVEKDYTCHDMIVDYQGQKFVCPLFHSLLSFPPMQEIEKESLRINNDFYMETGHWRMDAHFLNVECVKIVSYIL